MVVVMRDHQSPPLHSSSGGGFRLPFHFPLLCCAVSVAALLAVLAVAVDLEPVAGEGGGGGVRVLVGTPPA